MDTDREGPENDRLGFQIKGMWRLSLRWLVSVKINMNFNVNE